MAPQEASEQAAIIKSQLGIYGLGVVGAHELAFTKDGALTFKARLHYKGQERVRAMRVTISLNGLDYYDVHVLHANKWGETQREATFTDIEAGGLTQLMYRLDSEGI